MIAAHRRRHRRLLAVLAVLLPLLVWLAFRARPEWPRESNLPPAVERAAEDVR